MAVSRTRLEAVPANDFRDSRMHMHNDEFHEARTLGLMEPPLDAICKQKFRSLLDIVRMFLSTS